MKRPALILAAALAVSTCAAPLLVSQTDCSRWITLYKQGLLQQRAARRLRAAAYRLKHPFAHPHPALHHRHRKPMGPLASYRKFAIDCGLDLDVPTPELAALLPPTDTDTPPMTVAFPDFGMPPMDFPAPADVAELAPGDTPLPVVPGGFGGGGFGGGGFGPVFGAPGAPVVPIAPGVPVTPVASTPEPGTWLLVGFGMLGLAWVRREAL